MPQVQLQTDQRTRLREGKPRSGCSILAAVGDFYFPLFQSVQISSRDWRSSHSTGGRPLRRWSSRGVKLTTHLIQYRGWERLQPHTYSAICLHTLNIGAVEGLSDIVLAFCNAPFNSLLSSVIILLLNLFPVIVLLNMTFPNSACTTQWQTACRNTRGTCLQQFGKMAFSNVNLTLAKWVNSPPWANGTNTSTIYQVNIQSG